MREYLCYCAYPCSHPRDVFGYVSLPRGKLRVLWEGEQGRPRVWRLQLAWEGLCPGGLTYARLRDTNGRGTKLDIYI